MEDQKRNERQKELRMSVASFMAILSFCLLVLMVISGIASLYVWYCGFKQDVPGTMYCDYTVTWKDYLLTGLGPMILGMMLLFLTMGLLRLSGKCIEIQDVLMKDTEEPVLDHPTTDN